MLVRLKGAGNGVLLSVWKEVLDGWRLGGCLIFG